MLFIWYVWSWPADVNVWAVYTSVGIRVHAALELWRQGWCPHNPCKEKAFGECLYRSFRRSPYYTVTCLTCVCVRVLNVNDESSVVIHIPLIFISLTRSPQHFNPAQVWTCQPIRMKKVTKRYSRWRSAAKTGSAHSGLLLGNTGPWRLTAACSARPPLSKNRTHHHSYTCFSEVWVWKTQTGPS